MDTVKLNVTLRRAHKISERISSRMSELRNEASRGTSSVRVQAYQGPEQVERLKSVGKAGLEAIDRFDALAKLQAYVRNEISRMNASVGVSTKLAQIEADKKVLALLKAVLSNEPGMDEISLQALPQYTPPQGYSLGAEVNGVPRSEFERIRQSAASLERAIFSATDDLADLNTRKLSLDIPKSLAEELGLEAG